MCLFFLETAFDSPLKLVGLEKNDIFKSISKLKVFTCAVVLG